MRKITPALGFCSVLLLFAGTASSAGFGQISPVVVLGQPLAVSIPIHLDVAERFAPDCVATEVRAGDAKLPADQVRMDVVRGSSPSDWVARVTTTNSIEEPVIEINISAGCDQKFSRRYTAFADPPQFFIGTGTASSVADSGLTASVLAPVPKPRRMGPSRSGASVKHGSSAASGVDIYAPPARRSVGNPHRDVPPRTRPAAVPREAEVARLLLDIGGPRLKMDMEDPVMMATAVAVAGSGVAGESSNESDVEMERLKVLERNLTQLKKESQASRDNAAALKSQLASAESQSRLLPWIIGLLVLVGLVALWLALRLRQQGRRPESPSQWWVPSASADSLGPVQEPPPSVAGELVDEPESRPAPRPEPVWAADPHPSASPAELTAAAAAVSGAATSGAGGFDASGPVRDVSVEELLDLEQQAEFFIALGQEDAAVDLLMSHLRSTGGQSPLPYTKLLEIYRRQDDRAAYERVRARFNRRFNAYAPEWEVGPQHGLALEDYPEVVAHLQVLWPSPLDAMANLEAMLFRKDETREMFDLPAYQDVLLLYSIARDLVHSHEAASPDVDVLLPLGDTEGVIVGNGETTSVELPRVDPFRLTNFDLNSSFGEGVQATLDPEHLGPGPTDKDAPPAR